MLFVLRYVFLAYRGARHHALTKGGHGEEEGKGDPDPDGETAKGRTRFLFWLDFRQLMLATPTNFFIVRIPRVTIGAVHVLLSLRVAIAEW